ncbi:MAG TPA: sialidase family protein, partial [Candidatus Nitrosotalea sp.]|nr:sialidase family protein [Candidatus Nitrosotalea sp.]
WGSPIIAVPPQKYRSFLMEADKPWMAIDTTPSSPHRDAIYIVTNFNYFTSTSPLYSLIGIAHSDDHGKTWTTVHVGGVDRSPVIDYTTDLAIAADGTVYLSWFRCHKFSLSSGCSGPVDILLVKSSDGGSTWSKPVLVHRVRFTPVPCSPFGCLPNTKEGVLNIPVIASDNSAGPYAGSLYECDNTFTAGHLSVQVTRSADGGATWSAPVPVAGPGVRNDEFFQWCSVSKDGTLGVTWLDRRNDPANVTYEAFGAYSKDGGATFSTNYQLAARPSNPKHDGFGGTFMGDYTGNTWAGEKLYAAWQDTSNGHTSRAIVGGLRIP